MSDAGTEAWRGWEEHLLPLEEEHPGQWRTRGRGPVAALWSVDWRNSHEVVAAGAEEEEKDGSWGQGSRAGGWIREVLKVLNLDCEKETMEGLAEWNAYDLYFLKIALAVEWEIEYQWRERDPSVWRRLWQLKLGRPQWERVRSCQRQGLFWSEHCWV